ncbi:hypothetical protein BaRGS_00016900 [Batillaria attramentaria]|uniref:UDP-glycosyltransferases domain-containing protein n=1 Tax=Batillaria attramentaria TaxID=370345 RepID=A0ABD0KXT3_9CAEN
MPQGCCATGVAHNFRLTFRDSVWSRQRLYGEKQLSPENLQTRFSAMEPRNGLLAWSALATLLTCLVFLHTTDGKRVIVVPMPFTSHTKYQTNVARALARLGHEVWLTMPDFLVAKGVLDTTNFTVIEYSSVGNVEEIHMTGFRDKYFTGEREDWALNFKLLKEHCHSLLTNVSFYNTIKAIHPEFFVFDNIPMIKMLTILPYRLGVPFAFVGSAFDPETQRVPQARTVTPIPLFPFSDHMTFVQRLQNVLFSLISVVRDPSVYPNAVALYAPEMPYLPIDMLVARAEIWLVEMDHILDYPRPSLPNVKLIGGTATGPAKPLPSEFKTFMDSATEGVVIVSFGSYVLNLPKEISDKVFSVLQQLPFKSVFRSNLKSPNPAKILTSPWLPQNDLLGHPNTKVFVSHCGKNGQYEALFHAVPVVATPMFVDQPYNAERMRVKSMAETVDLKTVTEDAFKSAIMTVATDPRYKQAISTASELFRIEFGVPMERAAFWLDHVMKYGGAYMRSAGQEIPYYQFHGFDIYAVILGARSSPSPPSSHHHPLASSRRAVQHDSSCSSSFAAEGAAGWSFESRLTVDSSELQCAHVPPCINAQVTDVCLLALEGLRLWDGRKTEHAKHLCSQR